MDHSQLAELETEEFVHTKVILGREITYQICVHTREQWQDFVNLSSMNILDAKNVRVVFFEKLKYIKGESFKSFSFLGESYR